MTLPELTSALRRSTAPLVVGLVLLMLGRTVASCMILAFTSLVLLVALIAPRIANAFDRLMGRVGAALALGVSFSISSIVWVIGVLPIWVWICVTRSRPLRSSWADANSTWTLVSTMQRRSPNGRVVSPTRSGVGEPVDSSRSRGTVLKVVLVGAAVVGLVLYANARDVLNPGAQRTSGKDGSPTRAITMDAATFDGLAVDDYTHEHEPWARALFGEFSQLQYKPDSFLGLSLRDFDGRYVNVKDGHRVSYSPSKPMLTVWFFGGSTMFGIGQRDNHTIPSVISRLGEKDGIRLRAVNFGYSGFVNWQETLLFEQLLTSESELPDLAVFYDGINDRGLASFRVDIGADSDATIARLPSNDEERRQMKAVYGNVEPMPWGPERDALEIRLASTQYRRGVDLARRDGRSFGVPVVHFWQPQPFAKTPNPADDELWKRLDFNPALIPGSLATYDSIRDKSGVDPIDLTHVLDDVREPLFFDSSHTNELGARVIAESMYANLRPRLKILSGG